jgi:DNA-binding IclR family transcriptional regulator
MARAWEADFIRLWEAGASQAEMAQALGIPLGTVKSRAHTLQQQGRIQPRPRGGLVPVQPPVQKIATGAEHSVTPMQRSASTPGQCRVSPPGQSRA